MIRKTQISFRSGILYFTLSLLFITSSLYSQHVWINQGPVNNNDLYALDFLDPMTGVAVGDNGTILMTSDGGELWVSVASGIFENLRGVAFANDQTVFAVGQAGKVLSSDDQGESWEEVPVPGVSYDLHGIAFNKVSGRGVITGQTNAIIVTENWGLTWTIVSDGYMSTFYDALIVDSDFAVVSGWNSIFQPLLGYTLNGVNWDFINFYPTWGGVMYEGSARGGKFTDPGTGFIVGTYFVPGGGFLAPFGGWTSNAWDAVSFPQPLNAIDLLGSFGVIVGEQGFIAESTDEGDTWNTISAGIGNVSLHDIHLIGTTGYITGESGTILKMVTLTGDLSNELKVNCMAIYPNPATREIHVTLNESVTPVLVNIIDMNANIIISRKFSQPTSSFTIDAGELPKGIYVLAFETEDDVCYEKFLLQ
ncbi:MAG: YCF48-related protein [Bacteroidales bacterium]